MGIVHSYTMVERMRGVPGIEPQFLANPTREDRNGHWKSSCGGAECQLDQ